jgi:hypothetical protein
MSKQSEIKMIKAFVLSICLVFCSLSFGGSLLQAQTRGAKNFLIDENRPFVYIEFDHTGRGAPWSPDEPPSRIWLHLRNNCRVPIVVLANGVPDDSPKDEVGVMHDVVATRVPPMVVQGKIPSMDRPAAASTEDKNESVAEEMPRGYMIDVGSSVTIMPGKSILFSIPTNHITKRWHIEISFEFELPRGKCCRDPRVSLGPDLSISYGIWDLPPEELPKLEKR